MLLTGSSGSGWAVAARDVAESLDVPLLARVVGEDYVDIDGRFHEQYGLSAEGAVVVRPDGYVLWRSVGGEVDPTAVLEKVLRQALDR